MPDVRSFLLALDGKPIDRSDPARFAYGFTGNLTVKVDDAVSRSGVWQAQLSFATSPEDNHDFLFRSEVAVRHTSKVAIVQRDGAPVGQRVVAIRRVGRNDDTMPDRYEIDLDIVEDTVTGSLSLMFLWPFARVSP